MMRSAMRLAHKGLGLVLLSACGASESDRPPPGPFLGDLTEVTRIGEYETPAEEVFGSVRAAALIERGGVVILDGQDGRAVGFDDQGAHSFTFGGRGPGPGEFVDPSALFRVSDDTLAVLNRSARTLQLFAREAGTPFGEIGRYELPFWPSGGCSVRGRIFILGGYEDRAVHEVDRAGVVLNSFPESGYAAEAERAPESVAWDLRDQARSGRLVCSESSGHVIHVPRYLGWARAYTADGDLLWHAALPDFAQRRVAPAAGGGAVKYEFDPDFNYSHSVSGVAVVVDTHLAVSIAVAVPRGQEPAPQGLLALIDLATGLQTRRDEYAGIVMAGLGDRVAVVQREPFPTVAILQWGRIIPGARALQYGVRDSAGIRIAENPRPAPDSRLGWTVSAEPLVSIGTAGGEEDYQLHRVADATRLADGRIVVANGGSLELLVFDAEGNHLVSWGGEGEGPGEFQELNRVRPWAGDSLIAADPRQGRASIFDSRGRHGRTFSLLRESEGEVLIATGTEQAPGMVGLAFGPDLLIGVLPDGTLFTRDDDFATTGFSRQDHAYALKSTDGEKAVSLGKHPGPQTYTENFRADGGFMFIPLRHPFGQTTRTAVWGDLAVLGRTESYEIRGYRSDGSLARVVRRDFEPGTPTRAEQDAWFRRLVAGYSEERRARVTAVAANVPPVDAFPAFGAVVGDALGHLWVAEFERPGDEYEGTVWTVFDGEGRMLGLVQTPEILTVFEIGEDYILGEGTDDLGVEYVKMWRLVRGVEAGGVPEGGDYRVAAGGSGTLEGVRGRDQGRGGER